MLGVSKKCAKGWWGREAENYKICL